MEAAWAQQADVEAVRKAELRHARHRANIARRRRYNAVWMREYRARERAIGDASEASGGTS